MSMKDIYSYIAPVNALVPQTITVGGGAKNTGDVDLQGCNAVRVDIPAGASGDTLAVGVHHVVMVQHADDNGSGSAGSYVAVAAKDVIGVTPDGSGNVIDFNAPAMASTVQSFGYVGNKRFLKVTITPSAGTTNGMPMSVLVGKGERNISP